MKIGLIDVDGYKGYPRFEDYEPRLGFFCRKYLEDEGLL